MIYSTINYVLSELKVRRNRLKNLSLQKRICKIFFCFMLCFAIFSPQVAYSDVSVQEWEQKLSLLKDLSQKGFSQESFTFDTVGVLQEFTAWEYYGLKTPIKAAVFTWEGEGAKLSMRTDVYSDSLVNRKYFDYLNSAWGSYRGRLVRIGSFSGKTFGDGSWCSDITPNVRNAKRGRWVFGFLVDNVGFSFWIDSLVDFTSTVNLLEEIAQIQIDKFFGQGYIPPNAPVIENINVEPNMIKIEEEIKITVTVLNSNYEKLRYCWDAEKGSLSIQIDPKSGWSSNNTASYKGTEEGLHTIIVTVANEDNFMTTSFVEVTVQPLLTPEEYEVKLNELIAKLEDPNVEAYPKSKAAVELMNIADPLAVPALIECLSHADSLVKQQAIRALEAIGDSRAVSHLCKFCYEKTDKDESTNEILRRHAVWALAKIALANIEDKVTVNEILLTLQSCLHDEYETIHGLAMSMITEVKEAIPLPATIEIQPNKWNIHWLKKDKDDEKEHPGKGKIKCYIGNIAEHTADEILPETILLNNTVSISEHGKKEKPDAKIKKHRKEFEGEVLEVTFNKFEAIKSLGEIKQGDTVTVTVTGKLSDGKSFFKGKDTIQIIGKEPEE